MHNNFINIVPFDKFVLKILVLFTSNRVSDESQCPPCVNVHIKISDI